MFATPPDAQSDLDSLRAKHDAETQSAQELRETLSRIAEKGSDKEKELAMALASADERLRKSDDQHQAELKERDKKKELEIGELKQEQKKALDNEKENSDKAWKQLEAQTKQQEGLQTKLDEMDKDLKKKGGCQCVVM